MNPEGNQYWYEARLARVVDGDTVRFDVSLGFDVWLFNKPFRLHGVDTPEIRGVERLDGLVAKQFVERELQSAESIWINSIQDKSGKYGRYLAKVWYRQNAVTDWACLNDELLRVGMGNAI